MPTYSYRCEGCGPFDRRASLHAVPDVAGCPSCGGEARRGVAAPVLHVAGPARRVAAAHERSAHAPDVVTAVPAGARPGAAPRRPAPADPRHASLPRP